MPELLFTVEVRNRQPRRVLKTEHEPLRLTVTWKRHLTAASLLQCFFDISQGPRRVLPPPYIAGLKYEKPGEEAVTRRLPRATEVHANEVISVNTYSGFCLELRHPDTSDPCLQTSSFESAGQLQAAPALTGEKIQDEPSDREIRRRAMPPYVHPTEQLVWSHRAPTVICRCLYLVVLKPVL